MQKVVQNNSYCCWGGSFWLANLKLVHGDHLTHQSGHPTSRLWQQPNCPFHTILFTTQKHFTGYYIAILCYHPGPGTLHSPHYCSMLYQWIQVCHVYSYDVMLVFNSLHYVSTQHPYHTWLLVLNVACKHFMMPCPWKNLQQPNIHICNGVLKCDNIIIKLTEEMWMVTLSCTFIENRQATICTCTTVHKICCSTFFKIVILTGR